MNTELKVLYPPQLIAVNFPLLLTVLYSFKFKFLTLSPLLSYIYTHSLGLKRQLNLVQTRADEVPVIGMKNIYSMINYC